MKSYALLESFEKTFAVFELELHEIEESKKMRVFEKRTRMVHVPFSLFPESCEKYNKGDIAIIEHEAGFIMGVCGKDDDERAKRVEYMRKIRETFRKKD